MIKGNALNTTQAWTNGVTILIAAILCVAFAQLNLAKSCTSRPTVATPTPGTLPSVEGCYPSLPGPVPTTDTGCEPGTGHPWLILSRAIRSNACSVAGSAGRAAADRRAETVSRAVALRVAMGTSRWMSCLHSDGAS